MSVPLLDSAVSIAYPIVIALAGVGGAALAIVACTVALRALLIPLTLRVIRGELARAALAPQLEELNRAHRKDPERLRTELAQLYGSAGVSPYAGCLPALLQAPFFLVTYRLFASPTLAGHPNALLHSRLLGVPLSAHLLGGPVWVFLPLLATIAAFAWLAVRRTGARGLAAALPFGTVLTAAFVPLAAVLYLVTTTAWTGTVEVWLRRRGLT